MLRKLNQFDKRKMRVRRSLERSADRPRLSVFRSSKHIYAQVIDDARAATLAAASSLEKDLKAGLIKNVVFDRGGYRFHGRIKALADGARDGGLRF